ncbi:MAG: hypothetical protein U1D06_13735, partial [Paracoccaceae bacterium]|nr:hypothetical protein [Paracoccaceae bacterium]
MKNLSDPCFSGQGGLWYPRHKGQHNTGHKIRAATGGFMTQKAKAGARARAQGVAVLHRSLGARDIGAAGISRVLDAVAMPDGRILGFFGQGTQAAAFAPDGGPGCLRPLDLRDVAGGALTMAQGNGIGSVALALTAGGTVTLHPVAAEPDFLAGLNVTLGFRL